MERRRFVQLVGFLSSRWAAPFLSALEKSDSVTASPPSAHLEPISPHVFIYHDIVNVVVIEQNERALLINSGNGSIVAALKARGITVDWVLYTNYEREHCAGATVLKSSDVKIAVPATEAQFFHGATQFWQSADTLMDHCYDFRPDLSLLRASVQPDRELLTDDVFKWQGLEIEVVGTPGYTDGGVSYVVNIDQQRIAFTGSLIVAPGRLREFYKLQKPFPGMLGNSLAGHGGYWGFGGGVPDLKKSLDLLLSKTPSMLVPSHGAVMKDPSAAVSLLETNLDKAMRNYLALADWRLYFQDEVITTGYGEVPMLPALPDPTAPSWLHALPQRPLYPAYPLIPTSWYIQADDGSIFLFDCGFPPVAAAIGQLVQDGTIKGVDGIWISHYHDDHVASVNEIRRGYGAKVYAQQELQDILENPTAYQMPCLFPESIRVDYPLAEGQEITWKGYKLTAYYFPGQTLYHGALLVERDGMRVLLSGDSFANFGIDDYCAYNRNFIGDDELGYQRCIRLLLKLEPDMLLAAHGGPVPFAPESLRKALLLLREREELFGSLLSWDNPNFGLDPCWVRAYPFRQKVLPGQLLTIEVKIFNHSVSAKSAVAELRAVEGWSVNKAREIMIPPHSEGVIRLTARAPDQPRRNRDVLGVATRFGGEDLGEPAVAIVDYMR
jgi:glyoxylase-like metal-dependent hydrolase (beta-lactamase superfamily II)